MSRAKNSAPDEFDPGMGREDEMEQEKADIDAPLAGQAEQNVTPALEETTDAPIMTKTKSNVVVTLVGAGSYTGRGVKGAKKGKPFEVDASIAAKLIATGLFEAGKKEGG
jgi:hypothetical protein